MKSDWNMQRSTDSPTIDTFYFSSFFLIVVT